MMSRYSMFGTNRIKRLVLWLLEALFEPHYIYDNEGQPVGVYSGGVFRLL